MSDLIFDDGDVLTGEHLDDALQACYPDGVPETFPVELFAPVPAMGDFRKRDLVLQDKINRLEELMLSEGGLKVASELPIDHKFADGVYVRTMFIPKGTVVTGRVHLRECVNILVSGSVAILTVDGPVRLDAPQMFVSAAGSKKVVYANEDTVWTTTHSLPPTEPDKILDLLSVPTFADYAALAPMTDTLMLEGA